VAVSDDDDWPYAAACSEGPNRPTRAQTRSTPCPARCQSYIVTPMQIVQCRSRCMHIAVFAHGRHWCDDPDHDYPRLIGPDEAGVPLCVCLRSVVFLSTTVCPASFVVPCLVQTRVQPAARRTKPGAHRTQLAAHRTQPAALRTQPAVPIIVC
jgi:hypothetical protein